MKKAITGYKRWDIIVSYVVEGLPVKAIAERSQISVGTPGSFAMQAGYTLRVDLAIYARRAARIEFRKRLRQEKINRSLARKTARLEAQQTG